MAARFGQGYPAEEPACQETLPNLTFDTPFDEHGPVVLMLLQFPVIGLALALWLVAMHVTTNLPTADELQGLGLHWWKHRGLLKLDERGAAANEVLQQNNVTFCSHGVMFLVTRRPLGERSTPLTVIVLTRTLRSHCWGRLLQKAFYDMCMDLARLDSTWCILKVHK